MKEIIRVEEASERIMALASTEVRTVIKTSGYTGVFPLFEGPGLWVVYVETTWEGGSSHVTLALQYEDEHGNYVYWDQAKAEEALAKLK